MERLHWGIEYRHEKVRRAWTRLKDTERKVSGRRLIGKDMKSTMCLDEAKNRIDVKKYDVPGRG